MKKRSWNLGAARTVLCCVAAMGFVTPAVGAKLELEPCEIAGLKGEARCGTYEVYENRAAMEGRKIPLNVVVLPATGESPQPDPVVFFAGGPGGSTVDFAAVLATFYQEDLGHRDFLLVDYRGTGKSKPLFCPYQEEKSTGAMEALESFIPVDRLAECAEALSADADLTQYTTPNIVDDVAEVARALGYPKVNLSGGSYGTRAALVFLRRHPDMVRTAFLEGVVPMDARMPVTFAADAQEAFEGWVRECAADADCRAAFPDPAGDLEKVLAELDAEPKRLEVIDPKTQETVEVELSRSSLVQTLRYMLYGSMNSLKVPAFLHAASEGDWQPMAQTAYSVAGALMAGLPDGLYLSVTCPEDVLEIGPNAVAIQTGFLGDFRLTQQVAACKEWVAGDLPEGFHEPVVSDAPVLIVSGERDPVTPARWGYEVQEFLTNSVHLKVPHGAHGWFGLEGIECIDELASKMFETGSVAELDVGGCATAIRRPAFLLEIPIEESVEMAAEELERFVGSYVAEGGGFQLTVEATEGGLMFSDGEESEKLVPIGQLRFKVLGSPPGGFWRFVEEGGEITAVEFVTAGAAQITLIKE
jgi:pimeloyl-ACP methyl ester carboxylesterase